MFHDNALYKFNIDIDIDIVLQHPEGSLDFDDICRIFVYIRTSGLGNHYQYLRLSVLFEITVFEIAMVDSLRFAVEKKHYVSK